MTVNGWVATLLRFRYGFILLLCSGCANAFRSFPDPGSNDYLLDQAQACLDEYDFDCAVDAIEPVLIDRPDSEEVVTVAITAFAGRGGLRVLDLVQEISSGLSSSNLFVILADHFPQAGSADRLDIERAVAILEAYQGNAASRSASLNVLAFFLYYGQIGVTLSDYAYNGSATVGGAWDHCSNADDDLPDLQTQYIGVALANLVDVSDNLPSNPLVSDTFSSFSTVITALGLTKDLECPADLATCKTVRTVVGNDASGIGLGIDDTAPCL